MMHCSIQSYGLYQKLFVVLTVEGHIAKNSIYQAYLQLLEKTECKHSLIRNPDHKFFLWTQFFILKFTSLSFNTSKLQVLCALLSKKQLHLFLCLNTLGCSQQSCFAHTRTFAWYFPFLSSCLPPTPICSKGLGGNPEQIWGMCSGEKKFCDISGSPCTNVTTVGYNPYTSSLQGTTFSDAIWCASSTFACHCFLVVVAIQRQSRN